MSIARETGALAVILSSRARRIAISIAFGGLIGFAAGHLNSDQDVGSFLIPVLLTVSIGLSVFSLWRLTKMSETTLEQLKALRTEDAARTEASQKYRADVTAALARIENASPSPEIQAIIDELRASAKADTDADTTADAGLPAAPV